MRLPDFMLGSVRVRVPKIGVYLGLLGSLIAYVGSITHNPILSGVGIGMVTVMPIGVTLEWLNQRQFNRKMKTWLWPVSVQVMPGPDGERIAFVTSQDGTVSSLQLPDDYDPEDDQGEWLIREVAPELAAMIFGDEEED